MTMHQIPMQWDGEVMRPARGFAKRCDEQFTVGQVYIVQAEEPRSMKSHARFFAGINDAWKSLPEHLAQVYPSADHLRKRGLIVTGHRTASQIVCQSNAEALRMAALAGQLDAFCLAVVDRSICTVFKAESQSMKAMGKDRFLESVRAVEDWCADLIGTTGDALREHTFGRQAA